LTEISIGFLGLAAARFCDLLLQIGGGAGCEQGGFQPASS
jgi:hypothetical protein